ncbi:MAG TPA: hypothetical protein ENO23_02150 [Alphaproteobacteria bacterium]|nr:hypothetical protein [Alphaproteobacteria bacterium]
MSARPAQAPVLAATAVFVVASALVLAGLHADRRPEPVFDDQFTHPDADAVFVTALLPLEVELSLPARPSALRMPVWLGDDRRPLRIEVTARAPGGPSRTALTVARETGLARIAVPDRTPRDARWRLRLTTDATTRETSPRVMWSRDAPRLPLSVRYGGRPLSAVDVLPDTGPLLMVEYPWPTRWALLLFLVPAALVWPASRRGEAARLAWLVALALAATTASALLWQRDYTRRAAHLDADRYAQSTEQMARYVREPEARPLVGTWFREHPHSTTQLVPALLLPLALLGVPVPLAYMLLSALASWLALLLVRHLARVELHLAPGTAWLIVAVVACHPVLLRTFARPVTDAVGLFLVLATLALLARRARTQTPRDEAWLALVLLAHPLARPQGLGYWPFVALAVVLCDRVREERWPSLGVAALRQIRLFGPPLAVLVAAHVHFDWWHNLDLMLAKARRFRLDSTLGDFAAACVGVVQLAPWVGLLAGWSGERRAREAAPSTRLLAAWGLYATVLLVAVRAPFWLRHFLPVLPVPFLLAGRGLDRLGGARRALGVALLVAPAIGGVVVTLWQIGHLEPLPPWIAAVAAVP